MLLRLGLTIAIVSQLAWAFADVYSRYAITVAGADPVLYACLSLFVAAFALIVVAGPGFGGLQTLRSPFTWLYSLFHIFFAIAEAYCYSLMTTTEANFLLRLTVIFALVAAWLFKSRTPSRADALGGLVILVGFGLIVAGLPDAVRWLGVLAVVVASVLYLAQTLVAEDHPVSGQSRTIRDQCRVTGYILMTTSLIVMVVFMSMAWVGARVDAPQAASVFGLLPTLADFRDVSGVVAAVVGGLLFVAFAKFFYFYAARLVNTENYLIIAALLPVLTLVVEYAASLFGLLDVSGLDGRDILAGALMTAGALYMVVMRQRPKTPPPDGV